MLLQFCRNYPTMEVVKNQEKIYKIIKEGRQNNDNGHSNRFRKGQLVYIYAQPSRSILIIIIQLLNMTSKQTLFQIPNQRMNTLTSNVTQPIQKLKPHFFQDEFDSTHRQQELFGNIKGDPNEDQHELFVQMSDQSHSFHEQMVPELSGSEPISSTGEPSLNVGEHGNNEREQLKGYYRAHVEYLTKIPCPILPQSRRFVKSKKQSRNHKGKSIFKYVGSRMSNGVEGFDTYAKRLDQIEQQKFVKLSKEKQKYGNQTPASLRYMINNPDEEDNDDILNKHEQKYLKFRPYAQFLDKMVNGFKSKQEVSA